MISEPSGACVKLSGCDFGSVVTTSLGSAACTTEQTKSAASDRTAEERLVFACSLNGILFLPLRPAGIGSWAQFILRCRCRSFKRQRVLKRKRWVCTDIADSNLCDGIARRFSPK